LPERLEERRLLAADPIHVGVVYLETDYLESDQDVGGDSRGDRFILSFTGGAPDTELTELRIVTDKDGDGITVGDPIYDTQQGGRGKNGSHGFQVVRVQTSDGRQVDATADVEDGGQELVLRLSNFRAGDRLEFTIDVDEVLRNAVDLAVFNDRLDVITSGQEFQDSILHASFDAPHYENTSADAVFLNDYGVPTQSHGLDLPPDEGKDIDSRPNRSAAAVATTQQVAKPISVEGYVWLDNDLDAIREPGESPLSGIELALWHRDVNTGEFVDTNHRAVTDESGHYEFAKSLALQPGEYQVVQTQPAGLYSVAAVPGTVDGAPTGTAISPDILSGIVIPLGDQSAVHFDFAEAEPAQLSGYVYQDNNDNGRREAGETGIAGVTIKLMPIQTIAQQSELTVTTADDGSYAFTGLVPGTYEVIEVNQPVHLDDGRDSAGSINGTTVGIADEMGDRIRQIWINGSDEAIEYNFGEIPRGELSGFVYQVAPGQDCNGIHDAAGNIPLSGVLVQLQTSDGATIASTTTFDDGSYQFTDISKGTYRIIQITPEGLIDGEAHTGLIDGLRVGESIDGGLIQQITMTAGGIGTQYNFCEAAPASISGYVYRDNSDDGIRDASEQGIAGTTVTLVDSSNRSVAQTTTDANGRYEFTGVMPGEYAIVQTQPAGFYDGKDSPGTIDGQTIGSAGNDGDSLRAVLLKQGQTGIEYNFGELLGASLSGRVHADTDGDCVLDADESPLLGVVIRLVDSHGTEVAQTTTDANGQYRFDDLAPGEYTVIEEQPAGLLEGDAHAGSAGGEVETASRIGAITLAAGEVAVDYNFCEHPASEISGNVYNDADGDCVFDANESGIASVRVELYDSAGDLVASTQTDANGNYRFTNLSAGTYLVREMQPAGWLQGSQSAGSHGGDDSVDDVISMIPVGWGERLTNYNFCELEPSSISGSVFVDTNDDCLRDAEEQPLAGVTVRLRGDNGDILRTTATDADGRYVFDGLAPGRYEIEELQPEGYFHGGQSLGDGGGEILGPDHLAVTLFAGRDVSEYNFCELAPASITGGVWEETDLNQSFDPGDIPIAGVMIDLIDSSGDLVATTTTGTNGQYIFDSLAPGVYSVREHQPDGLFHGGQNVGSHGGTASDDDFIVGIQLGSGEIATNYDFAEVPPAVISGFVFQDGDSIIAFDPPRPEDLREIRDGQLTDDDTRLGGIEIELRNLLGQPVDASRALAGVYAGDTIRTTTDENGYYFFAGLRPGTYHVYQVQPDDFVDGLDTPGTTGGIAVNPADPLEDDDRITIQTLAQSSATDPRNDAILNVALAAGQSSEHNNFSEIVIAAPPIPLIPLETNEQVQAPDVPIDTFESRIRLVTFASPAELRSPIVVDDEWAVSWHLSVINGGYPRGEEGDDSIVEGVSAKRMQSNWSEGENAAGNWQLYDLDGNPVAVDQAMSLGTEDALALAGDFDGDGNDEAAIYAGGSWYVDMNGNGYWDAGDLWIQLGTTLDHPVVGDWDGDGKDDIAIFGRQWQRDAQRIKRDPGLPDPDNMRRRSVDVRQLVTQREDRGEDRERLLRQGDRGDLRADAVDHVFQYGEAVDLPVAGDWNGDGIDQIAVFRSGIWLLDTDGDGRWTRRDEQSKFGRPGDEPIVGDFDGDGIDEIGVVRGDLWIIDTDGDRRLTGNDLHVKIPRAEADSQPVVGDWDGDGADQPGYYDDAA
tara:strand:+ start:63783 stop:68864 length:5082 start_codon:yes stop_codon:yes gene_type:complete